ncbi:MAG: nucleotidyltransferase family protein [Candidatus Scalindua sp.]|nr:nucleotidyltransferase family protein [Candidatus Scalindua sp.]
MQLLPEEQFITYCLRSELGDAGNGKFSEVDFSSLNWDVVYERSMRCGITPSLYKIIQKKLPACEISRIPKYFVEKVKFAYIATSIKNKGQIKSLVEVLKVFQNAGIKVILLKGSHLVQFVYKDLGFRPMSDIDIMVKKDDMHKAVELLFQMGYGLLGESNDAQEKMICIRELIKSYDRHMPTLCHRKGIKKLDLHWTLPDSPVSVDIEGIWNRALTEEINGTNVLVLSSEDLLLHLSFHASIKHRFNYYGMKQLCDIATTINKNGIDWDKLILNSEEFGAEKCLYLTLRLSKEILDARVPETILQSIKPDFINEKIVIEAQKRVFSRKSIKPAFEIISYHDKLTPNNSLFKRISFVFKRIFIKRNELMNLYSLQESSNYIYFYYFARLVSLLYYQTFRLIPFFLYPLLHKKFSPYVNDLDLWLLPQNPMKKNNLARRCSTK